MIHRAAVRHRPKSEQAYAYDEETVHVRLRTERGDVTGVTLLWGDKYDWDGSSALTPMRRVGHDDRFDYWEATVEPPHRRLAYAFHLVGADGDKLRYDERGFEAAVVGDLPTDDPAGAAGCFEYPFVNPADVHDPPEWVSDAVFYQIFPERFANGDPSLDPEGVEEWGGRPDRDSFYGGDLRGVIDNLDYLAELGVTALYFTPLFASPSNHKYNTTDYEAIDPQFGDEEDLRELVEKAHDRGMRVMLDAVFNHCGRGFEPFQDVVEHGEDSEYADWFHVREFPVEFEPRPSYDAFAFEAYMPKLNTEHPEVREYLLEVATYWVEEMGIDGWRLDVANEVDHAFWREFREAVKRADPEAYILGEVWHDSRAWLRGDQFDAVMNYLFTDAVHDFVAEGATDATAFANALDGLLARYPRQVTDVQFNLLGSHDTPRLLHRCDGDEALARLSLLLLFSYPGTPCVYYGDEVGMTGGDDPDCRRPMTWDPEEQNRDLLSYVRALTHLRTDERALRRGDLRADRERSGGTLIVFRRVLDDPSAPDPTADAAAVAAGGTGAPAPEASATGNDGAEALTIAVNRGDEAVTVPVDGDVEVLVSTGTVAAEADGVRLGATAGAVWR